ncbi:hypothetical protein ACI65C_009875 [Semiaphis heraclei]
MYRTVNFMGMTSCRLWSVGDNELGLENYVIFRCDRNPSTSRLRRGGGTLIAVRKDVRCLRISPTSTNVEHLFVKFSTQNISFILSSVYIPPSSPFTIYESHVSSVQTIALANTNCTFIFCGDFNLPDISWSNDNYGLLYSSPSSHCLPESFSYLNLFQLNNVSNNQGKHLDLVFSNNNNIYIEKSSSNVVPCDSYHPALDISLSTIADTPSLDKSHTYFNFRKTAYPEILNFLNSFNWPETINNLSVDSATNALYDALHSSILLSYNLYLKTDM